MVESKILAPRQDFEALTVILSVALIAAIVSLLSALAGLSVKHPVSQSVEGYSIPAHLRNGTASADGLPSVGGHQAQTEIQVPKTELERRVMERFNQAVGLLHAKQYEYAITALDAVLAMAPEMPEAYVNMGYAFIGLEEYGPARNAFEKALSIRLDQTNAFYGLAMAYEGLEDYEAALGAMRSYIHLSPPDDPYLAKARAALWEWEGQLGRLKGIQPAPEGAEPEELRPQVSGH